MTNQNRTTLRQADNKVFIEGLLLEKEVKHGETSDKREFLSVKLTIGTSDSEQHQVEMFSMKLKSDGTENGIYKSLETVANDYSSVKEVGKDQADFVRTDTGEIRLNDYVNDRGLQSFPQISATFINRVEGEPNPHARFSTELVFDRAVPEMDKEGEETGRAILHGYIPLYGGRIIPFEFKVAEDGADYVQSEYEKGDTIEVQGVIINKVEKIITKKEGGFGGDLEDVKYNTVREFLIQKGSLPYEEDNPQAYDLEAIGTALNEREVYLEGLKNKYEEDKKNKGASRTGFDTTPKTEKRSVDKNKHKLPF